MATAKEKLMADKGKSQKLNDKLPKINPQAKGPYRDGKKPGDMLKKK